MQSKLVYNPGRNKMIFFLVLMILTIVMAFNLQRIVVPFAISYIIALMLRPLQKSFFAAGIKKKIVSILALGFFIFTLSYPVVQSIKTISEESHKIEYYLPKMEKYLKNKYTILEKEIEDRFNYKLEAKPVDDLISLGKSSTKSVFIYLPKILASLLEWSFIIPLFIFFLLKDERNIRFHFLKIVPNNIVERAYFLYHQFNNKFGDYIFAKFIEATIVGIVITTGLLIIGYPFAFLLGIIAAVTNILPYIGPILGFLPALVIGLVDQNPNTTLGAMVILYLVANIIDLALVFPLLVSKIVNLHPVLVIIAVIVGSQFGGVLGMVVSIPLAAFFKLLFQEIYLELYGKGF